MEKISVDSGNQFRQAMSKMDQLVTESIKHGHFKMTVEGQIGKGKRREVIINAGKEYKYTIPVNELP